MTRYAQVAINLDAPLGSTFHYHLPADLADTVRPGHLVEVEFGSRLAQGLVVALDDRSPVPETKPIIALALPDPVLSPVQLQLADWLSATYLAPLNDCIRLMLPPGISQRADVTVELIPNAADGARLTEAQQALVNLLAERGDLRGRQISRLLPELDWKPAAEQLARRGILLRGSVLAPPRAHPKKIRTAQLTAGPKQVAAVLPTLGRTSKAADALDWLASSSDPLPAGDAVQKATGCSQQHLDTLADQGHVTLTPGQTLVALARPVGEGGAEPIIQFLLAAGSPVVSAGGQLIAPADGETIVCPPAELERLAADGLIHRIEEPDTVSLTLTAREARTAAADLRGAAAYLRALDFMSHEPEPVDVSWVYAAAGCNLGHLKRLAGADLISLGEEEQWRDPLAEHEFFPDTPPALTDDQARAWGRIKVGMLEKEPGYGPAYLLHGVTGSGKTEIYLRAIDFALARGETAVVLVPEIALTPQTVKRFAARFPGRIALWHSRLTDGERYDTWRRARMGMVEVVIGPRSALFAPLPNLGVIVLDEEHDEAYKQDPPVRPPYYHAREAAVELARLTGAALIMGSATPDLVTYHRARRDEFQLLELPLRIMGHRGRIEAQSAFHHITHSRYRPLAGQDGKPGDALTIELPPVEVVDMRQELRASNRSIFSRALAQALGETLARGEQAILFLNRRGTATYVFCRDCGLVLQCPRCDLPLTYHKPNLQLVCHHCGRAEPQPDHCPRCGSGRVKYFGLGTEGVEAEVARQYPAARVLRWDRDTTGGRGMHDIFLQRFVEGQADVLVGTQMIAKGLDLPLVTLVGVVSADVSLGLPDYRTGERTFQVLTQVAGRAGRGLLGGRVLLQTFNPEHYAIRAAAEHDYAGFYLSEMEFRSRLGFPPYRRLARLEYRDPMLVRGRSAAEGVAAELQERAAELKLSATEILGPTQPFFSRVGGRHRWQIVLRAPDPTDLLRDWPLPDGWRVDIDPISLL